MHVSDHTISLSLSPSLFLSPFLFLSREKGNHPWAKKEKRKPQTTRFAPNSLDIHTAHTPKDCPVELSPLTSHMCCRNLRLRAHGFMCHVCNWCFYFSNRRNGHRSWCLIHPCMYVSDSDMWVMYLYHACIYTDKNLRYSRRSLFLFFWPLVALCHIGFCIQDFDIYSIGKPLWTYLFFVKMWAWP